MEWMEALSWGPHALQATVVTIMGLGLAATCGLRAFLPLLVINLLALTGFVELGDGYGFMEHWTATIAFSTATIAEVAADKFPGFDHAMDAAGTIIRPTAAAVAASSMIAHFDPLAGVVLGMIGGAAVAAGVQVAKAKVRVATTTVTGGLGNWVVSLGEDVVTVSGAAVAVLAPVLFIGAAAALVGAIAVFIGWRRQRRMVAAHAA